MKSLILLFLVVVLARPMFALETSDLAGTWKGTEVMTVKGKKETAATTIQFRLASGKLVLVEQAIVQIGKTADRTLTKFGGTAEGGKFGAVTKRKGKVVEEAGGSWFIKGDALVSYPYASKRYGTVTVRLAKSGRAFLLSATYSDGTKVSGRFVRQ